MAVHPRAGGLVTPDTLGLGHTQEESIRQTWSTFDEVELQLTRQGIPPLEQPRCTIPHITAHLLNESNNREFSTIYANFGEWFGYISSFYGRILAKLVEVDNEMNDISVQNRRQLLQAWRAAGGKKTDKPTIQELSDYNELHNRYRELKHERQQWEQQRLILLPRREQLKKDQDIISRQVTIRGQELERHRVGGNMASRYHQPQSEPHGA